MWSRAKPSKKRVQAVQLHEESAGVGTRTALLRVMQYHDVSVRVYGYRRVECWEDGWQTVLVSGTIDECRAAWKRCKEWLAEQVK